MALWIGWLLAAVSSIPQLFVFGCFQPIDSTWTQCVSSFFIQEYLDQIRNTTNASNTTTGSMPQLAIKCARSDYDVPIGFLGMTAETYGLIHLIISFYIPFVIIAFCYVWVYYVRMFLVTVSFFSYVSVRMSRYTTARKNKTCLPTVSIELEKRNGLLLHVLVQ